MSVGYLGCVYLGHIDDHSELFLVLQTQHIGVALRQFATS